VPVLARLGTARSIRKDARFRAGACHRIPIVPLFGSGDKRVSCANQAAPGARSEMMIPVPSVTTREPRPGIKTVRTLASGSHPAPLRYDRDEADDYEGASQSYSHGRSGNARSGDYADGIQAQSLIRHHHWAMMFRCIVLGTAP
jgi:hypothetical protein